MQPRSSVSCTTFVDVSSRARQSWTCRLKRYVCSFRRTVSSVVLYLKIKSGITLNGHYQCHGFSDLDQAVSSRSERTLSGLDVELRGCCIAAECDDLLIQHIDRQADCECLVDVSLPQTTYSTNCVPDFLDARFVLKIPLMKIIRWVYDVGTVSSRLWNKLPTWSTRTFSR